MIINDDNITAINIAGYFLTKKELTPKKLQAGLLCVCLVYSIK